MKIKSLLLVLMLSAVTVLCGCADSTASLPHDIAPKDEALPMPTPGSGATEMPSPKVEEVNKTEEAKEPTYEKISFIGCGDNIIYYGNVRDAQSLARDGKQYDFTPMYDGVKDIVALADIAFINQETVMDSNKPLSYYPTFNSPTQVGLDLLEVGYDVINIANNHMLDKGASGLESTIRFWKSQDCLMIGGYENAEDYDTVRTLEKNGIKLSFLSYTYATNGITKGASSPLAIPYINDEDIIRQTVKAKSESEFVIASIHWGDEGAFKPNAEQQRVAQLLADCGVDVIIGHHPHVIQKVEWLTGKDGNRTLCVYSLGNFAAEQAYAYNMVGGIISFDIVSENDGRPVVENPVFIPTVYHFNSAFYKNTVYLMSDYTEELALGHGVRTYYGRAFSLPILKKYVTDYIPVEFLPADFN
ncbi:MAG: CapA family protein [Clostridia bacterium]|nr:CapA family protein [Clostridia bacterium]